MYINVLTEPTTPNPLWSIAIVMSWCLLFSHQIFSDRVSPTIFQSALVNMLFAGWCALAVRMVKLVVLDFQICAVAFITTSEFRYSEKVPISYFTTALSMEIKTFINCALASIEKPFSFCANLFDHWPFVFGKGTCS